MKIINSEYNIYLEDFSTCSRNVEIKNDDTMVAENSREGCEKRCNEFDLCNFYIVDSQKSCKLYKSCSKLDQSKEKHLIFEKYPKGTRLC